MAKGDGAGNLRSVSETWSMLQSLCQFCTRVLQEMDITITDLEAEVSHTFFLCMTPALIVIVSSFTMV